MSSPCLPAVSTAGARPSDIGQRYVAALDDAVCVGDHVHYIGVAVGVAFYPDDGTTAEEIMHRADLAMYAAKAERKSNLLFFEAMSHVPGGLAVVRRIDRSWLIVPGDELRNLIRSSFEIGSIVVVVSLDAVANRREPHSPRLAHCFIENRTLVCRQNQ